MSKDIFRFKRFDLHHKYGFRVSTEACLFGAYVSRYIPARHVLDIGTGTGLLSLMYAQNNGTAHIQAVEIDAAAATEAKANFAAAATSSRFNPIFLHHQDVGLWQKTTTDTFDLIITNPPFFKSHLLGQDHYQNSAKHQSHLSLDTLAKLCSQLLKPEGQIAILLPVQEQNYFKQKIAEFGYSPYKVLNVYNRPANPQFRKIVVYKKANTSEEHNLIIYNEDNTYTEEFKKLMQEYYIIF